MTASKTLLHTTAGRLVTTDMAIAIESDTTRAIEHRGFHHDVVLNSDNT